MGPRPISTVVFGPRGNVLEIAAHSLLQAPYCFPYLRPSPPSVAVRYAQDRPDDWDNFNSPLLTCTFLPRDLIRAAEKLASDGVDTGEEWEFRQPIYATLSDIVVYSPRGLASSLTLYRLPHRARRRGHPAAVHNAYVLDTDAGKLPENVPELMMRVFKSGEWARRVRALDGDLDNAEEASNASSAGRGRMEDLLTTTTASHWRPMRTSLGQAHPSAAERQYVNSPTVPEPVVATQLLLSLAPRTHAHSKVASTPPTDTQSRPCSRSPSHCSPQAIAARGVPRAASGQEAELLRLPGEVDLLRRVETKVRGGDPPTLGRAATGSGMVRRVCTSGNGNGNANTGTNNVLVVAPTPSSQPRSRPSAKSVSFAASPSSPPIAISLSVPSSVPQQTHTGRPRAKTSPWLPSFGDHQSWFNDPRFDGRFPSLKVYRFCILGMGTTRQTRTCCTPSASLTSSCCSFLTCHTHGHFIPGKGPGYQGSLWIEEREGRIKVLDIKGVCDDGIDTLEPQLEPICEWIGKAREEGGQVLVHCRVGVSRSATVVIEYVMKHLALPLVDAYLIVRSRRLSVLIQLKMRLLYNLCAKEEFFAA
ncbi:hypothetical protein MKEN_00991400 [Mycena kentingensis (nom. inval.)]|nr:hypothetical protein MKEN_00991400 [Mycena kentingensis (nom. inval.)]